MSTAIAEKIRRRVENSPAGAFFRVSEFEGSRRAVESAFSRLALDGRLVRARRGLYWKGVASRFGSGRPRTWDVAFKVLEGRGAGPAGWSAAYVLGLSTQVPPKLTLAVVGPPPAGLTGVVFHSRRNLERLKLNYREIALLEVLRTWPRYTEAEWPALVDRTRELVSNGNVNWRRLLRAARHEPSPAVRNRVRLLGHSIAGTHELSAG